MLLQVLGLRFLNVGSRIKGSGGFCLVPGNIFQVPNPRIQLLGGSSVLLCRFWFYDPCFCYQVFGGSRFQDSGSCYLIEHTKGCPVACNSVLAVLVVQKVDPGPPRCDCTQEGVDQGADSTQGFEEKLWQLVFSSAGVFCLAAHLHWAPVGSGGSAVRH